MPNNTESKGGTEVAMKKDFIEIVKRWCGDSSRDIIDRHHCRPLRLVPRADQSIQPRRSKGH